MTGITFGWSAPTHRLKPGFGRFEQQSETEPAMIEDLGDSHGAVIGPTGKGKSRSIAIPNLVLWDGPVLGLDVKGELARTTAIYRRDVLKQQVVILDPWGVMPPELQAQAGSLNPLTPLRSSGEDLADDCVNLASLLEDNGRSLNEPYWSERAQSLIAGLMTFHASSSDGPEEACLSRVYDTLHSDDVVYNLAVALDTKKDMNPFAYQQIAAFTQTVEVTRSGILSTAQNMIRLFGSGRVRRATDRTSFDLGAITRGDPLTIYLVVPAANIVSHSSLIRLWLSALMSVVTRRVVRPEKPTLFLLDEVAQLGPMPQIVSAITLGRSYGMRCLLLLQSLNQLKSAYPKDHETIVENCESIATFGHVSRSMSNQVAAILGDVSGEELFAMGGDQLAVRCGGRETRIARKLDYLSDPLFAGKFKPNPMFGRGF